MPAHWDTTPQAWDQCVLGKFLLPGVAKVSIKRSRKFDKKSAKGKNGATITDGGGEGAEVTIELSMTTADEWEAFCALASVIDPAKVAPQAFGIVHPQTEAFQVASVMIADISADMPSSGIYTAKIKCEEWFPTPKKGAGKGKGNTTTPKGASGASNILDMARDKNLAKNAAGFDKASNGNAGPPPPPSLSNNKPTG